MSDKSLTSISLDGLWNNNPALVQLLGLCPLLAVTGSVVNALGLGLATMLVLVGSNLSVSLIRIYVSPTLSVHAFSMILVSFLSVTELVVRAWFCRHYQAIVIFIASYETAVVNVGRADALSIMDGLLPSFVDS